MNNTPIGALPLEIREMVYENFFGGDFFRVSLAPLTICDEMNAEANRTLARIHKTAILDCGNDNTSALTAPDFNQLRVLAQRFSAIPQNLKSRLTFEVQHDCSLLGPIQTVAVGTTVSNAEFTRDIRNLVATVSPCNVVISVNFLFNSLSGTPSTSSYHVTNPGLQSKVCPQGDPMSSQECEQVVFKIPADDKIKAQKIIDEVFAAKCGQFEAHRAHRVCFIRLGIDETLQNLVDARDMMTEMVGLL
jgi:hypothetical protein